MSLLHGAMCAATSLQKKPKVRTFQGDDVQQRRASAPAAAETISKQRSVFHDVYIDDVNFRDVYIDVVAVADYGVFSKWVSK